MTVHIPDSHRALLAGPVFVTMVTMLKNGWPQASIVWCKLDGDDIIVNSAPTRLKHRNILRNPKVTILAMDPENGYRYLEVRGEVIEIIDNDEQTIDELARLYTKYDRYFGGYRSAADRHPRVTYRITPRHIVAH